MAGIIAAVLVAMLRATALLKPPLEPLPDFAQPLLSPLVCLTKIANVGKRCTADIAMPWWVQAELLLSDNFPQELRAIVEADLTKPQHLYRIQQSVQLLAQGLDAPAIQRLSRIAPLPVASILHMSLAPELPELHVLDAELQGVVARVWPR